MTSPTAGDPLAMNGVAYWFSDRLALRMAHACEVSRAEAPALHAAADRLAAQYGVPRPRVSLSPDPTPNAFATGRSPKHAAIVVNRGLLDLLGPEEAYGVLAHEFAHVRGALGLVALLLTVILALRKLERASQTAPSPLAQPAFAHLSIVSPLSGRALAGLFSTHPPVEERIARLEALAVTAPAAAR